MSDKNFKMNQTQNTFSGSIPRPPNSFILYRREKRHDIVKQAEDSQAVSNSMVSKMAAEMWKREAPEVKAKYIAQAEELRKSHRLKFPDFKYSTKEKSQQAIQRNMASASQPMRPMMYYNPRFVEQPAKRDHHWNTMSPVSPVSPHSFTPPMTPAMDPRSNPYYTQPWPRQEHIRYAQPIYAPRQVSMRPPQLTQQSVYSQPRVYAANQYPPGHSYSPSSPTAPMYVYAPPEPQQTHPSHRTHKHYNAYHPYAHPPPIPDPYLSYRRY